MKKSYRGFEIEAKRERCLGGWNQLYLTVYRESDGLEVIGEHTEDTSPVVTALGWLKRRVDEAIETKGASECLEEWWQEQPR